MDQLLILPAQQRVSPSLLESLKRSGWRTTVTEDMVQAKQLLQRGGISGIIVEIAPQGHDPERMKLLRFVREFCPDTTVIILHSEGTIAEGLADEKLVQELDSLDRSSAQIASSHSSTSYRLTPSQNLSISGISAAQKPVIEGILAKYGLNETSKQSGIRLNALSCVALPTCGLALADCRTQSASHVFLKDIGKYA